MKKCAKCAKIKKNDRFYKTGRKNGLSARCKNCHGLSERICIICDTKFEGKPNTKLCSKECRIKHRPQTFKKCNNCGVEFGPIDHLNRKFCSYKCKVAAQSTGRKRKYISTKKAINAQRKISYAIQKGIIKRASDCEECGAKNLKIEAAHFDYNKPMLVRWLCRSCHVKWDKKEPKDKGYSIIIKNNKDARATGQQRGAI